MSISYFDIFPDAKLSITPKPKDEIKEELDPNHVGGLIKYLFAQKPPISWATIDHIALCKRVFLVIFDGLDNSRWNKYRTELSAFSSMKEDEFPQIVHAKTKNQMIVPAFQTLLGYSLKSKERKKFGSFEEMTVSLNKRYDNGYPIRPGTELPSFSNMPRYKYFKIESLTDEQLQEFKELPEKVENSLDVIAIDAEMISTTNGEEVARISGVDQEGNTVIDEYFKPLGDVIDYRTQFSGITEEKVKDREITSDKCLTALEKVADKHTIIIGHSLENDFRALKLIHDRLIDTALVYNSDARYPSKPPLARIYSKYIKKDFRTNVGDGHDSVEDAKASLELAKHALQAAVSEVDSTPQLPKLFTSLLENVCQINSFGPNFHINYEGIDERVKCFVKEKQEEVVQAFIESLEKAEDLPPFSYVYLHALSRCNLIDEEEEEACRNYNAILVNILEKLPAASALIVYTANGNTKRLRSTNKLRPGADSSRMVEFELCRQGLLWVMCKNTTNV